MPTPAPFVTISIEARRGQEPLDGIQFYYRLAAEQPIFIPSHIEHPLGGSVITKAGIASIIYYRGSYLENLGLNAYVVIQCPQLGINGYYYLPDEDSDFYDLVALPEPPSEPVPPVYRTATVDISGEGAPSLQLGRDGDYYTDTSSTNLNYYHRANGVWTLVGQKRGLVGPRGLQGIQGPEGPPSNGITERFVTGDTMLTAEDVTGRLLVLRPGTPAPANAFSVSFPANKTFSLTIRNTTAQDAIVSTTTLEPNESTTFEHIN